MKQVRLPTRADDPLHLLLWSIDELVPVVAGLVIGMIIEQALLCLVLGLIVSNLYKRFRDQHADGYLEHLFYHYGFGFTRSRSMINPFIKRLFP